MHFVKTPVNPRARDNNQKQKKKIVGGGLPCNCHCYDYARDEFRRLEFAIEPKLNEQQRTKVECEEEGGKKMLARRQ